MTPIGTLGLEPTTIQVLVAHDVKTVEDLVAHTPGKLRRLGGFARRHLNDVKARLASRNLKLQEN